jgi:hypothetical protein
VCFKLVIYKDYTEMRGQQNINPLYSCSANHSKSASVIYQSPLLTKPIKNSVRIQPGVHVNCLNIIFRGNLSETQEGLAGIALCTPLVCTDKILT